MRVEASDLLRPVRHVECPARTRMHQGSKWTGAPCAHAACPSSCAPCCLARSAPRLRLWTKRKRKAQQRARRGLVAACLLPRMQACSSSHASCRGKKVAACLRARQVGERRVRAGEAGERRVPVGEEARLAHKRAGLVRHHQPARVVRYAALVEHQHPLPCHAHPRHAAIP